MIWSGWLCMPAVGERVFAARDGWRNRRHVFERHRDSVRLGALDSMRLLLQLHNLQGWNKGET
jgi:hypothetical protein